MTRETYCRMVEGTRRVTDRLPGGAQILKLPTLLCAACYLATLLYLAVLRDMRLARVILVPAACFLLVTALRPMIGRQRPYDRFDAVPVGRYKPGKGKSMPSRHTASAAAIAMAVAYAFPTAGAALAMGLLCAVIAALRVLAGQHYVSDVLAALAISGAVSLIGYML